MYRITHEHDGIRPTEVNFCETPEEADALVAECAVECAQAHGIGCGVVIVEEGEFDGFNFTTSAPPLRRVE